MLTFAAGVETCPVVESYYPCTTSERSAVGHVAETAFRRYYGDVYRFLLRRTADPGEAEELSQRVFADAAAAARQLEQDDRPLLPWLLAVAHRRWVDELRRRHRQQGAVETLGVGIDTEHGLVSEADLQGAIRQALDSLPFEQRQVVLRRLLYGQRFSEIAGAVDTSEGAVKMRFRRGLELLRERLREEGYAP
ncbi:MAG: RNA polymerase sigma factor [Gaiellaceae bacterium]